MPATAARMEQHGNERPLKLAVLRVDCSVLFSKSEQSSASTGHVITCNGMQVAGVF